MARNAADELRQRNVPPILTRTGDTSVSLKARVSRANDARAAAFVSLHCNSAADGGAHGTEAYHRAESEPGKRLAAAINRSLQTATGLSNRGTKAAGFYVLEHTDMPAALVEIAFISNDEEEMLLRDEAFRAKAARAIAEGIVACLGEAER